MRARVRTWLAAGLLASGALACARKDAEQPPKDFSNPSTPAQPAPAKFALADFNSLRYLEGMWKGRQSNGNVFYESYHFVNDSTIFQANHTDSTFKTKSDSSLIIFRNGAVVDSNFNGKTYTAEKLDLTVVDFRASPDYHFAFTRESDDAWTARLYNRQAGGQETVTTYPMRRIRR